MTETEDAITVPDYIRNNYQPDPMGLAQALRREAYRRKGQGDHTAGNLLMAAACVIADMVDKQSRGSKP
jgi:hypothetical protein